MRERIYQAVVLVLLLLLIAAMAAVVVPASTADYRTAPTTYHWEMTAGDDAYVLCGHGQFRVTANGADSLYLECGSFGAAD